MLPRLWRNLALIACLVPASGAMAADLSHPPSALPPGGQCIAAARTPLLGLAAADLRLAVEQRYVHAVETAQRIDVVYSARPAHVWALATRYSCGKAIGYLKARTVDELAIGKCACFYDRMLRFMP